MFSDISDVTLYSLVVGGVLLIAFFVLRKIKRVVSRIVLICSIVSFLNSGFSMSEDGAKPQVSSRYTN